MVRGPRKIVVAGLITDSEGRVLVTQRCEHQAHPLEWEFPGGKIEPGEAPSQALQRELREELGARVHIGRIWDVLYHDYGSFEVLMLVYHCRLLPGERVECLEINDFSWCFPDGLDEYALLPADRPLISRLQREGVPVRVDIAHQHT